MSVSNIIEVAFGSSTLVFTEPYYKYNSGMYLQFSDLDLPESYQVHFANSVSETSLEMVGTSDGVLIPDDVWQTGATIYAWVYLHPTNDSAVTKYEVRIPVSGRADLPDGVEPTEAEQTTIDTLVNALNTAVEDAEQAKEDAEDARDESATNVTHYPIITGGYWYVWDAEQGAYVNTNVKAEGTDGDDYVLTDEDKAEIASLVNADGLVVTATPVSSPYYSIDSTYSDIESALADGRNVVVINSNNSTVYPYVGTIDMGSGDMFAFGISTTYNSASVLWGFLIAQDNSTVWVEQTAIIPDIQINGTSITSGGVANIPLATSSVNGAMSATDKANLDTVYADYSSALTALGVI